MDFLQGAGMRAWLIGGVLVALIAAAASAAEEGERQERQKEPAAEPKKKTDHEAKPADAPKPPADDKGQKAEPPPAQKPEVKPDESGKKPVVSMQLTIKLALMAEPAVFPFEIEVEMDGHKAVLSGTVPSEDEKAKAAEIARKVEGVESVVNKLSVSPALRAALTKRQDEAIAHLVKERLNKSETLKAVGFDVKSENGIVMLSGKTRFQVIAFEAAEAARQVPGVRAVNTAAVQLTGER
jgi:hyperosmotically inducible periplasmic protein